MHKSIFTAAILGLSLTTFNSNAEDIKKTEAAKDSTVKTAEVMGECFGGNTCKGKGNVCASEKHGCGGNNECAGQGTVEMTEANCKKIKKAKWFPAGHSAQMHMKMEKSKSETKTEKK